MKFLSELVNFIIEFCNFIIVIFLAILAFIVLNAIIDSNNPCSNFSDKQDYCQNSN